MILAHLAGRPFSGLTVAQLIVMWSGHGSEGASGLRLATRDLIDEISTIAGSAGSWDCARPRRLLACVSQRCGRARDLELVRFGRGV